MILIIKDDWRKQEEPQGILELGEIIMMEDTLNLPASVGVLYWGSQQLMKEIQFIQQCFRYV